MSTEPKPTTGEYDDSDMDSASIPAALQPKPTIGDIAMLMCNGGLSESIAAEQDPSLDQDFTIPPIAPQPKPATDEWTEDYVKEGK
jgi:hypothetical protein